jgi:hypothetical protein
MKSIQTNLYHDRSLCSQDNVRKLQRVDNHVGRHGNQLVRRLERHQKNIAKEKSKKKILNSYLDHQSQGNVNY